MRGTKIPARVPEGLLRITPGGGGGGTPPLFALEGHLGPGTALVTNGASVYTQFLGRPTGLGPPPTPEGATQAVVIEGPPGSTFGTSIPNNRARCQFRLADVPVGTTFDVEIYVKVAGDNLPTITGATAAPAALDAVDLNVVNVDVTIDGAFQPGINTDSVFALVLRETGGAQRSAFCGHFGASAGGL